MRERLLEMLPGFDLIQDKDWREKQTKKEPSAKLG